MTFKHLRLLLPLLLTLASTALAGTTWYVNGVTGSDINNCLSATAACKTIGHAISLAATGDTIKVAPATYPENLNIGISLKITGSGGRPVIDGGGVNTVVTISSAAANVTLSGLRIQNGSSSSGMGGVSNVGELTLNSSSVASNSGVGISNGGTMVVTGSAVTLNIGLGIMNGGTLTVNHSIISRNSYGGISNSGAMTIISSTIAKNTASGIGSGIYNWPSGTLILNGTTVSQNVIEERTCTGWCFFANGGIWNDGSASLNNSTVSGNYVGGVRCKPPEFGHCTFRWYGGGIVNNGTLEVSNSTISANGNSGVENCGACSPSAVILQNSILSKNGRGNCSGLVTSNGYNLSSDAACAFSGPGDMNSTDPLLGPLQNNGGPTQTMALPSGSPAIDAGNPVGCTDELGHLLTTDQRGMPRPDKEDTGGCDIGAYESQSD